MHDCVSTVSVCACDQQPEMSLAHVAMYQTNACSVY